MKTNYIQFGDSYELLKRLDDNCIDIIITSPPYNASHKYDVYNDNLEIDEYNKSIFKILEQCYRVLKDDGRLCINVPFAIKNMQTKDVYFLAANISEICNKLHYKSFEFITWHKGTNINHFQGNNTAWGSWKSPSCPNFRPMGECVLVFYKKDKTHKGNSEDIDISSEEFKNWTKNVWYFEETNSNVIFASNNADKTIHPAPFPEELVERLLKIYSYKNDIVLDPFNGIGTTTYVAKKLDRQYIGYDLSEQYCQIAEKRIESLIFSVVEDLSFSKLVNTASNKDTLNEIFSFKESFSPLLFDALVERYKIADTKTMYEPFLGTGSIFLNKKIENCYGNDINPLAINITKAKIEIINENEINNFLNKFKIENLILKSHKIPAWNSYDKYVEQNKYDYIMSLFELFENLTNDEKLLNFLKMTIVSNLDKIFNYKRDGNGIKFRKSKISLHALPEFLNNLILKAISLKLKYQQENKGKNLNISAKTSTCFDENIKNINLIITSPPYCNMFDYFEVYKIELWTSGLVKNATEMQKLKKSAIRSNYNANINGDKIESKILNDCLANLKEAENRKINMINNYFYDINNVISNCYKYLNKNGLFCIVVGNSFYQGCPIKTDIILAELAQNIGFEIVEIIKTRTLPTSSQQMKIISKENKEFLRESIIVLRRI